MKKTILFLSALFISAASFAQVFEGTISFKETKKDTTVTTSNIYHVKGNAIKLDQINKKTGKIDGSFVFDLAAKTVKFVNPDRKIWGEQKNELVPTVNGTPVVEKTKNVKTICGLKCTEYVVTNTTEKIKISYWIYSPDKKGKKFDFFIPMVELMNRKDPSSVYWRQIKNLPAGSMPLLSIATNTDDGKQIAKLETTKVEAKAVPASDLAIPPAFKKFSE